MIHELIERGEKVQLAFDVLTSSLELEEPWYYFEDLLNNFRLWGPEAVLELVDSLSFNKDIHNSVMVSLKSLSNLNHALHDLVVLVSF